MRCVVFVGESDCCECVSFCFPFVFTCGGCSSAFQDAEYLGCVIHWYCGEFKGDVGNVAFAVSFCLSAFFAFLDSGLSSISPDSFVCADNSCFSFRISMLFSFCACFFLVLAVVCGVVLPMISIAFSMA